MANNANDCVICLESLATTTDTDTVGVATPCGHCFHTSCWEEYKASGRGRVAVSNNDVDDHDSILKCPMCNGISNQFVKIFIDFKAAMNDDDNSDDDDDENASLSSVESNDDNRQEERSKRNRERIPLVQPPSNFVDLVNDEDSTTKINGHSNKENNQRRVKKYKLKGKALKKNIEEFKAKHAHSKEEVKQLDVKCRQVQDELDTHQSQEVALFVMEMHVQRDLEGTRLQCATASRQLRETQQSVALLKEQAAMAVSDLKECKKTHQANLAKSMNEADKILKQHPKALEKRRTLRTQYSNLRSEIQALQQQQVGAIYSSSGTAQQQQRRPSSIMSSQRRQPTAKQSTVATMSSQHSSSSSLTRKRTAAQNNKNRSSHRNRINKHPVVRVVSQEEQQLPDECDQEQHGKNNNNSSSNSSMGRSSSTTTVKRKVSEQAARMDMAAQKAPKRGALELLG